MTFRITRETTNEIDFELTKADVHRALRLKNLMVLGVYTMAIDVVNVLENEGLVHDDQLRHRVGLLPVRCDDGLTSMEELFNHSESCPCGGKKCTRCAIRFTVNIKSDIKRIVYSHDFQSSFPERAHLLPGIPITEVLGSFRLEAFAVLGKGETKWQPTAPPAYYTNPIRVTLNPQRSLTDAQVKDFVTRCPRGVFDSVNGVVRVANSSACTACGDCNRAGFEYRDSESDPELVKLEFVEDVFLFHIVSVGQLRARTIMEEALRHERMMI